MSSIDDRIVQMQFNNDQFQKGVADTNKSLDSLQDHLQLDGATNGINAIQDAANNMNLGGIADGVQHISDSFSALGAVAFSVLNTITTDAIHTGEALIGKVLDPIVQGGQARAIALEQAQFQFKGLGLNIQDTMAAALAAVKGTAFGLDEAATAAAQFGASGIDASKGLEKDLRAVAGVAAQTGSSYSSIANIFETISGNGRLMGEQLNQLSSYGINAAATLGKSMGKSEADVRAMVTDGDISFQQFSDAMYNAFGPNAVNANQTFQGALANTHAALARLGAEFDTPKIEAERKILNAFTDTVDAVHAALNPLIDEAGKLANINADNLVKSLKGLDLKPLQLLGPSMAQGLDNLAQAAFHILQPLKNAFVEVFPPASLDTIKKIGGAIEALTAALDPSIQKQQELKNTFAGLFAIVDIGFRIIGQIIKVFADLFGVAEHGSIGFLGVTSAIGLFLVKVDDAIKNGTGLTTFFHGLEAVLKVPIELFKLLVEAIGWVGTAIDDLVKHVSLAKFADDTSARFSGLIELGKFFQAVWGGIARVAEAAYSVLQPMIAALQKVVTTVAGAVADSLTHLNFEQAIQAINTGLFAGFLFILNGFFGNMRAALAGNGVQFVQQFKTVFSQLKSNLKALELSVDAKTIFEIAAAVALLAASAIALSLVDPAKLAVAMGAITVGLGDLLGSFALINKIPKSGSFIQIPIIVAAILGLAVAIDILTVALVALSFLSWDGIAKGLTVVTVLLGEFVGISYLLDGSGPGFLISVAGILALAGVLLILSGVMAIFAALSWEGIAKGLSTVTVLLGELIGTTYLMASRGPGLIIAAASILALAVALSILAGVVAIFAALSWESLAKGLGSITVLLIELVAAAKLMASRGPGIIIAAAALVILGVALNIIAGAVAILGSMSLEGLAKGLVSIAVLMAILVISLVALSDPMVLVGAAAMLIVSAALVVMSAAMKVFGSMSWDSIGRALTVLAASLLILAVSLTLMGDPLVLLGAASLIIAAGALALLAPAMKLLGSISWDSIGRGLTVLASTIAILALGGILLLPALPGLLGLGLALMLMGTGAFYAGAGLSLIVVAITAFVGMGAAAFGAVTGIIGAFIAQLPAMAVAFGEAIGQFALTLSTVGPAITAAFVTILTSMLNAVDTLVPLIVSTASLIIVTLVSALTGLIPFLVNAGLLIISGILQGIAANIGGIVQAGINIITNLIGGISAALPGLADAGAKLVISFIESIASAIDNNSKALDKAISHLVDAIIGGLTGGIEAGAGSVIKAAERLVAGIPTAIAKILHINSPSKVTTELGEFTAMGMVVGLNNMADNVTSAASDVGQAAIDGLSNSLTGISSSVNDNLDVQPTITPVLDLTNVKAGAAQVGTMLGGQTLSVDNITADAATVNTGVTASQAPASSTAVAVDANGNPVPTTGGVTFIQNNTSPKSLSTADIYRQTKNSISLAREALAI